VCIVLGGGGSEESGEVEGLERKSGVQGGGRGESEGPIGRR
jgi:hypothetical protein